MDRFEHVPTAEHGAVRALSVEELVEGARLGKDEHIGVLRSRFGARIRAVVLSVETSGASEVVDDVFVALPDLLKGYEERGNFEAWLRQVARNRARTRARSARARERREVTLSAGDLPYHKTEGRAVEGAMLRQRVLDSLDGREREAWLLFEAGYGHREIATRLDVSESNSQQIVSRARKKLRARFEAISAADEE